MIAEMVERPGMNSLKAYLDKLEAYALSDSFQGCLLMNNLAEKNIASGGALARVEALCDRLEELIRACLLQAKADGEIPPEKDPSQLANFILCFVHGLVLYARMDGRKKHLPLAFDNLKAAIER